MSTTTGRLTIIRHRLREDLLATLVVSAIAFGFTLAVTFAVSAFADVRTSGWDIAVQLSRWYVGGWGVYLTAVYLPLYIAHGQTRRAFVRQVPPVVVAVVALFAVLITAGYAMESVIYRTAGWTQELSGRHLFDVATDYPLVFAEFGLLFLVYAVGGVLAGAAFYRGTEFGLPFVPLLLAAAGLTEAVIGSSELPFVVRWAEAVGLDLAEASLAGATIVVVACTAVLATLAWFLVRGLPVRTQSQ